MRIQEQIRLCLTRLCPKQVSYTQRMVTVALRNCHCLIRNSCVVAGGRYLFSTITGLQKLVVLQTLAFIRVRLTFH